MNKVKKIFFRIIPIVMILMIVVTTNVFAKGVYINSQDLSTIDTGNGSIGTVDSTVYKVWNTVSLILQILAVAAIVFAGVRYMFASADGKADIKKQTIGLVVGAILVFGASFVINFIVSITQEVTASKAKYSGTTYLPKGTRHSDYDNDGYNDWDDIISKNGIPDIYEQDTNKNGIVDFEDLWLAEHPEDK